MTIAVVMSAEPAKAQCSGNVCDNAAMESFFSSFKTERTARKISNQRRGASLYDWISEPDGV